MVDYSTMLVFDYIFNFPFKQNISLQRSAEGRGALQYEAERHRPAPPAFFDQKLNYLINFVSENGLKAHSFQILGGK